MTTPILKPSYLHDKLEDKAKIFHPGEFFHGLVEILS
jgi:hypothetical protein